MNNKHLIITVEESANLLGFYDPSNGNRLGTIQLSLWPHEVAVDSKGKIAYVTNFGVRDYDLSIGFAGNSISVIDLESMNEIDRLYTTDEDLGLMTWAPHGVKVSPDDKFLYVNVERTEGSREPSPGVSHGQEQTLMLVFNLKTKKVQEKFFLPKTPAQYNSNTTSDFNPLDKSYSLLPGTHNFVFSPDGKYLWLFSGVTGVTKIDPITGEVRARLTDFNGAVRSLYFSKLGNLLVSATNEVSLVDVKTNTIIKKFENLGVGQILYSKITHDEKYILAPAVWEGKILVIDVESGNTIHRLTTGIDPVQIELSPDGKKAISTHGRSNWLSEIDLETFTFSKRINTIGGPNGAKYVPMPSPFLEKETLTFYAFLPFSNKDSAIGREIRLGYQFWNDKVNNSGGIFYNGKSYWSEIEYIDTESKSDPSELKKLMENALKNSKIDFLLGTYGDEANKVLAELSDKHNILNITSTFYNGKGSTIKNTYAINKFEDGILDESISSIFSQTSPKPNSVSIISTNEARFINESKRLISKLKARKINILKASDNNEINIISPQQEISKISEHLANQCPDIILINGAINDNIELIKSFELVKLTPGAIVLNDDLSFSKYEHSLKNLKENLIYLTNWSSVLENASQDRFGNAFDFAREYYNEYSEHASSFAAGSAAVGIIYEEILRNVKSNKTDAIIAILKSLSYQTFYDRFEISAKNDNLSKQPYMIQIQDGKEVLIWPKKLSGNNKIRFNN